MMGSERTIVVGGVVKGYRLRVTGLVEEHGEVLGLGLGEHAGECGEDGDGDLDDHAPGFGREVLFHGWLVLVGGWGYVDGFVALNSNAKVRRGDCGLRMMVKIICKRLRVKYKRLTAGRRKWWHTALGEPARHTFAG